MQLQLRPYQEKILTEVLSLMRKGYKKPLVVLPTGGGKTALFAFMASQAQAKGNTVWFLVHRRELLDQTLDTFERFDIPLKTIHVSMVSQWKKLPPPDMIVMDEAHHSKARTWLNIFEAYPDVWTIGLTATPTRLDGKPLGDLYDCMAQGPTTYQLINMDYLSNYKYVAPPVQLDLSQVHVKRGDYDPKETSKLLRSRTVYSSIIDEYKRNASGRQAIYFCTTIEHSAETAEAFQDAGINAVHFDGNTPKKQRKEIIQKFRTGEIQVLCNVSLIGEGFDMPDCEVVGLVRPTQSLSVYLQQVGRCLRYKPGKTAIILDHVGNYQRHGLPDDTREWSLNERAQQYRKMDDKGNYVIRYCPNCYAAYRNTLRECPVCGSPYETTQEELEAQESIKLVEISRLNKYKFNVYAWTEEALENAKTYSDLCTLAKARGYKTGWAYHQAKARGIWVPSQRR
jgi:superfamily II DNA or RNA helicase